MNLKNTRLKATLPRLKILEIFRQAKIHNKFPHHLTADDIYRKLLNENLEIGLATVYRVLTQFEQIGLLSRNNFESGTGKAMFELNSGMHHDHLVCLDCGIVEEFIDEQIEKRQKFVASEQGFILQEHVMVMYGVCKRTNCQFKLQKPKIT